MKLYNYTKDNVIAFAFDKQKEINSSHWDEFWSSKGDWINKITPKASSLSAPIKLVKRFIKPGASILEAGCGMGQYVYKLNQLGYDVHGVDSAENAVELLNANYKNLKITNQSLGNLNFDDCSFDAYYSGGVIEHFWEGYMPLLEEAHRILKKDGIIILTFPFMNKARKKQINSLPIVSDKPSNFYQFALDEKGVINDLISLGFNIKMSSPRNGIKGYMESINVKSGLKYSALNSIYSKQNIVSKILRRLVSKVLCWMGYGHTIEIVAIKQKHNLS